MTLALLVNSFYRISIAVVPLCLCSNCDGAGSLSEGGSLSFFPILQVEEGSEF